MNILIVGHDSFENKGCQALIYTTTQMLHDALPDAHFRIFSWNPEEDAARYPNQDIPCEFIRHRFNTGEWSFRNRLWLFLANKLGFRTEKILWVPQYFFDSISWADLVVVSGGDILADYGEEAIKHYFFPIAVANALKKPVYVFAQSISRYTDRGIANFCKEILDHVSLITVRERLSYDYLAELGIKAPVHLVADPAFTLMSSPPARVKEIADKESISFDGDPVIGISVSATVTRWGNAKQDEFVQQMAETIRILLEKHPKGRFIFVPHVTYHNDPKNDDRQIGKAIIEHLGPSERIHLIEGDYNCDELKGIIGKCDLFVGARTHATIASTSQKIPTISFAYSVKAMGIMQDILDPEKCVLDVRHFDSNKLVSMIDTLLQNKAEVVSEMEQRLNIIKQASCKNGELATQFFDRSVTKTGP